jgi:dTDP-4-dehydrorhamnose 3,5-epimerase-like enzyme|tara:strand:+ start:1753 stop:2157 length:405 start_codon:yes stop_codon:yes gene_type:complete
MKKVRKFRIKSFSKSTGKLMPLNFDKKFPIRIKRVFFIYGKKNKIRGEHAHKKCAQLFIPIFGKVILYINTPNSKKKIMLNHLLKTAVLVPPKYWCSIKFVKKNSILMVACNQYYKVSDYIQSFAEYKKYLKEL